MCLKLKKNDGPSVLRGALAITVRKGKADNDESGSEKSKLEP
jgi:hypothetical protein